MDNPRANPTWKRILARIAAPTDVELDREVQIGDAVDKAMPMVFDHMAKRFGISAWEAAELWGDHIKLELENSPRPVGAWVEIWNSGRAMVFINTNVSMPVRDPESLARIITHELEHFFQETLIHEHDPEMTEEDMKLPWIDRTHEQSAILSEIILAKEQGMSKEEFKAEWKHSDDYGHRMDVIDHLWDLADEIDPASVVGKREADAIIKTKEGMPPIGKTPSVIDPGKPGKPQPRYMLMNKPKS